jgi:hypothetical protein
MVNVLEREDRCTKLRKSEARNIVLGNLLAMLPEGLTEKIEYVCGPRFHEEQDIVSDRSRRIAFLRTAKTRLRSKQP